MSRATKLVGKILKHNTLGTITVDSVEAKSQTLVHIVVQDRGAGWDEIKQQYKGVKTQKGWFRGENRQFGFKDLVHINTLNYGKTK